MNPEIKRFALFSPLFFKPTRPGSAAGDKPVEHNFVESPTKLVSNYLGSSTIKEGDKCNQYFANLEKCFTSSVSGGRDPDVHCQYYVQSLKRESCGN